MLQKIYLIDYSNKLVNAWKQVFGSFNNIEIIQGDFFSKQSDAIPSK